MKNQNEIIANIQHQISEECSKNEKEIIQLYWKLKDNEFVNSPRSIKKEYNITQSQLIQLISKYSSLSFSMFCENCKSYENHEVKNQTKFINTVRGYRNKYSNFYKCNYCKGEEEKFEHEEQRKKYIELNIKFNKAIENKNWENLSNFDKIVLKRALEMNFSQLQKYYLNKLGQSNYDTFTSALVNIEKQYLLLLKRNSLNNSIINHGYIDPLLEHKDEIKIKEKKPQSSVSIDKETNTIKLKLTINEFQKHPDSPLYAGLVKFKEKIVIEPDVEYIFGHWKRSNNNLYLTLTPLENMDKLPSQKRISNLPISMQKGVTDFLKNMGQNLDF